MLQLDMTGGGLSGNLNLADVYSAYSKQRLVHVVSRCFLTGGCWRKQGDEVYNAFKKGTPLYVQVAAERDSARTETAAGG